MTKLKSRLSILLMLQILLAAGIYWSNLQNDSESPYAPLLAFDANMVDKLDITADKVSLELVKVAGQWQLPQSQNLPVNATKLNDLLERLSQLKPGWPTTTTQSSHERFEVADDHFQRHLVLYQGDKELANLYLGTSPGFRKIHARSAGQDAVYAVELNHFDLPNKANEWLDKSLISAHDFNQIKGVDYALSKEGDEWKFVDQQNDVPDASTDLDKSKAEQLVSAFENLTIQSVAEKPPQKVQQTIEVKSNDRLWHYEFVEDGEHFYVRRDDRPSWFNLSKADYQKIAPVDKQQLALHATPDAEKSTEQPSNS